MAWIEVHQALVTHRKLKALARSLRVRRAVALGHLVCLWCWALDNAPDGDLAGIDERDIQEAADWPKKPGTFLEALVATGFLDDKGGQLIIHDWDDYAGRLIANRAANADRMRRKRAAEEADRGNARAPHVTRTSAPHVQGLPTVPNQPTQPTQPTSTSTQPAGPEPPADEITRCVQAYDGLMGSMATTPPILRQITEWYATVPPGYAGAAIFERACTEAALNDGKSLKYVLAILKRWKLEGEGDRRQNPSANGATDAHSCAGLAIKCMSCEAAIAREAAGRGKVIIGNFGPDEGKDA